MISLCPNLWSVSGAPDLPLVSDAMLFGEFIMATELQMLWGLHECGGYLLPKPRIPLHNHFQTTLAILVLTYWKSKDVLESSGKNLTQPAGHSLEPVNSFC